MGPSQPFFTQTTDVAMDTNFAMDTNLFLVDTCLFDHIFANIHNFSFFKWVFKFSTAINIKRWRWGHNLIGIIYLQKPDMKSIIFIYFFFLPFFDCPTFFDSFQFTFSSPRLRIISSFSFMLFSLKMSYADLWDSQGCEESWWPM